MSKIFFITPPAQGHFNPVLPVMQELVRRGEQVICYINEEFRRQIEKTGVEFRAYPITMLTAKAISEILADGNLSKPHLLNARCVTVRDAGLLIDDQIHFRPVRAETLHQSLQEVLTHPHYAENAKRIQKILRETGGFQQAVDRIQAYLAESPGASAH